MRARRPENNASQADRRRVGTTIEHAPVMVGEVIEALDLKPGAVVVDATVGLGGHALAIGERIRPGGRLLGFDWDSRMLAVARERLSGISEVQVTLFADNFRVMPEKLRELGLEADAILFDLGLNTAQVLDPSRGFSFRESGPLDMRMDTSRGEPASALLNRMSLAELEAAVRELGDERWARAIAKRIFERRKAAPLRTTRDLVECVLAAIPSGAREKRIHPATRTFQAARILVNRELEGLGDAIEASARRLKPGGRLAVISYHSGEDRIVKRVFRFLDGRGYSELFRKPRTPSPTEIAANPRSRSAKLRALRRIPADPDRSHGRDSDPRKETTS